MADFAEPGSHNASEDIRMGTSPDSLDLQLEGSEEPASEMTSPVSSSWDPSIGKMKLAVALALSRCRTCAPAHTLQIH